MRFLHALWAWVAFAGQVSLIALAFIAAGCYFYLLLIEGPP